MPAPADSMTARAFSERFKPFLPVRRIAEAAGFKENTWYTAVSRGRTLTPDERARLRAAVEAHVAEVRTMADDLA